MNTKKLITFILWAFVPMIGIGIVMHLVGGAAAGANTAPEDVNLVQTLIASALSAAAMFLPIIAVIMTQLTFKEPVLKGLDISFKVNKWWVIGALLIPVMTMATLGMTLLMPGAKWDSNSELMQMSLQGMPEGFGVWGLIGISMVSGLFAGITINGLFAFGEEIAWRGFLLKEFKGKKFLTTALWTGIIWGLWHAPIILNGHNYPEHPVAGVFMMTVFCVLFTPILMYFRQKSGSVVIAAIMHGVFNGVAGICLVIISPFNDLLYGATGLAGFIVLLLINICIYLYDRHISKENIYTSLID